MHHAPVYGTQPAAGYYDRPVSQSLCERVYSTQYSTHPQNTALCDGHIETCVRNTAMFWTSALSWVPLQSLPHAVPPHQLLMASHGFSLMNGANIVLHEYDTAGITSYALAKLEIGLRETGLSAFLL